MLPSNGQRLEHLQRLNAIMMLLQKLTQCVLLQRTNGSSGSGKRAITPSEDGDPGRVAGGVMAMHWQLMLSTIHRSTTCITVALPATTWSATTVVITMKAKRLQMGSTATACKALLRPWLLQLLKPNG